jgi:hypothetical protein
MKYLSLLCIACSSMTFAQASPGGAPAPSVPAPAATSAAPAPCTDPEHHRFDFWVGRWDVFNAAGRLVSHSLIESVYGCGIRENWMPLNGQNGGSLSIYVPADHGWEQFWIDSSGSRVVFKGGWNGTAMVISGVWPTSPASAQGPMVRMSYTVEADGSVRQFGESSQDNGQTWAPAFNFLYRRHTD